MALIENFPLASALSARNRRALRSTTLSQWGQGREFPTPSETTLNGCFIFSANGFVSSAIYKRQMKNVNGGRNEKYIKVCI